MTDDQAPASTHLPVASDGTMPVPVYDCHVILSPADEGGTIHGRVSSLPGITAAGKTERDVLLRIVREFKAALIHCRQSGQPIPWSPAPEAPGPGESQRWIPVHL